jgi:hypothetical protein
MKANRSVTINPQKKESAMQGIEKAHCNAAIKALLKASYALWQSTVEEVLRPILAFGKSDTLGMDAMPEITIIDSLRGYDENAVIVTEESGITKVKGDENNRYRTIFFSDPTDRSAILKKSLDGLADKQKTLLEVVSDPEFQATWEKEYGFPVEITGASSSITCVRVGVPIFSIIVNYVTRNLFLACSAGCYKFKLPDEESRIYLDTILAGGEKIFFRDLVTAHNKRFVTFLGKKRLSRKYPRQ